MALRPAHRGREARMTATEVNELYSYDPERGWGVQFRELHGDFARSYFTRWDRGDRDNLFTLPQTMKIWKDKSDDRVDDSLSKCLPLKLFPRGAVIHKEEAAEALRTLEAAQAAFEANLLGHFGPATTGSIANTRYAKDDAPASVCGVCAAGAVLLRTATIYKIPLTVGELKLWEARLLSMAPPGLYDSSGSPDPTKAPLAVISSHYEKRAALGMRLSEALRLTRQFVEDKFPEGVLVPEILTEAVLEEE